MTDTYAYEPYGAVSTTGSGATADILFAGGQSLGGLTHFGARYYDPATATSTQQDPLNQISSLAEANGYVYVGGNPVNGLEPTGVAAPGPCSPAGPKLVGRERARELCRERLLNGLTDSQAAFLGCTVTGAVGFTPLGITQVIGAANFIGRSTYR